MIGKTLIIICAITVGGLSIGPHLLAVSTLGEDYKGVPYLYLDNEDIYLARIQEIHDGYWMANSPVFFEYKANKSLVTPVGELFYALPGKALRIAPSSLLVFYKFLLPAVLFLLIYRLVLMLTVGDTINQRRFNAIGAAFFVTLGYDLVDLKTSLLLLSGNLPTTHLLLWTRPVNPIIGILLLVALLIILWKIIQTQRTYLFIPAGIIIGLTTFYYFTLALSMAIVASLIVIYFIQKKFSIAWRLVQALVLGLVIQLPYWKNVFFAVSSSEGQYHLLHNGVLFSRSPVVNTFLLTVSIIYIVSFIYQKISKKLPVKSMNDWWWFSSALLLGSWAAFNQQLITGKDLWHHHFVQYTIPLCMIIIFVLMFNCFKTKAPKLWVFFIAITVSCSLFFGAHSALSYTHNLNDFRMRQNYGEIFNWTNAMTEKDCVIFVVDDDILTRLIPAFTHCNVYHSQYASYGAQQDRILHNYLLYLRLNGLSPASLREYLQAHISEVNGFFFTDWREQFTAELDEPTRNKIEYLIAEYDIFLKENSYNALTKYRIDYIIAKKLDESTIRDFNLIFSHSINGYSIYSLADTSYED